MSLEAYGARLFAVVERRWRDLLDGMPVMPRSCKVVLEFNLHSDGQISEMQITDGQAEILLGLLCQRAVLDSEPYDPWPASIRCAIGADQDRVGIAFCHDEEISNPFRSNVRRDGTCRVCVLSYPPPTVRHLDHGSPGGDACPWLGIPPFHGWPAGCGDDLFQYSLPQDHSKRVLWDMPKADFPPCPSPWVRPPVCVMPQR